MRSVRSLLLSLVVAAAALAGFSLANPAGAFCDTSEGCSPCLPDVIVDGKHTRIEHKNC